MVSGTGGLVVQGAEELAVDGWVCVLGNGSTVEVKGSLMEELGPGDFDAALEAFNLLSCKALRARARARVPGLKS